MINCFSAQILDFCLDSLPALASCGTLVGRDSWIEGWTVSKITFLTKMGKILCYCWCLLEKYAPVTWSGYIYGNFTASVVHIQVKILASLQYPPSLGQTWSYLCFFNHFPLILASLPSVSWLAMPITHIPSLHWALSIITASEMSLSFPFFHPSLCLSFSPQGVVMGWWVDGHTSEVCHAAVASLTSHHLLQPSSSKNMQWLGSHSPPHCVRPTRTQLHWMHVPKWTCNTNRIQEHSKTVQK